MPFSDYRTAFVTGASGGMGRAIAERLAAEGLEVHAAARNAAALDDLAGASPRIVPHRIDVTDTAALEALLGGLEIDVLVNNAGVSRKGNILSSSAFDIDEQIDVNLKAAMHCARLTLPGMIVRDRGHIVNISSIAGHYEFGGHTAYHASKAALHSLSRQLRVDAYGHRVRVTEICPGRVQTDIFARVEGISPEQARKQFFDGFEIPSVTDIADAVAYAIATPGCVNIGMIEIMPTMQVPGGLRTLRPGQPD
ncbi:MAG: SDR family oxidoreductase [Tropicimonas sp.]|uniref:SDR family oxidoreductase n=1 Tax=Tropicimonas sp. TaxID=2067044 RepID=UPI003A878C9B